MTDKKLYKVYLKSALNSCEARDLQKNEYQRYIEIKLIRNNKKRLSSK